MEYDLIKNVFNNDEPHADLIEAIGYSSINPYFKGAVFRRLLIKYRQNGCFQRIPLPPPDVETIKRYAEIRKKRMRATTLS